MPIKKSDSFREPIAVVGIGCRFPGNIVDEKSFWEVIARGIDTSSEIPVSRWNVSQYYHPEPGTVGKMYTKRGCFVQDVEQFDPIFFGISGREAQFMDPQQRLLLEVCYEAIEKSCLSVDELQNYKTGVYIGCMNYDYAQLVAEADNIDLHANTGTTPSALSGRIAHAFGLSGPVLTLDTACSSSLLGIHLACQSLRSHETQVAIAGGVNLQLTPFTTVMECAGKMLSADGRCKAFSDEAEGFGRGDGCGVVILMRLADALHLQLPVMALVHGSAVNHDGSSGAMTVPNGSAQSEVIQQALQNANKSANDISYVECHGTGTALGDPIEIDALNKTFKARNNDPLWIGSIKTNFGHTEAAAGIASFIKTALMLQHKQLVPHLHFDKPSKKINWSDSIVKVNAQLNAWKTTHQRYAGVSSFGLSGTNAHVIMGETAVIKYESPITVLPLCLSAKTVNALEKLIIQWIAYLNNIDDNTFSSAAYTSCVGRQHHKYRLALYENGRLATLEQLEKIKKQISQYAHKIPALASECILTISIPESTDFSKDFSHIPAYKKAIADCRKAFSAKFESNDALLFTGAFAYVQTLKSLGINPAIYLAEGQALCVALASSGALPLKKVLPLMNIISQKNNEKKLKKFFAAVVLKQPQVVVGSTLTGALLEEKDPSRCLALFMGNPEPERIKELRDDIPFQINMTVMNEATLIKTLIDCYYQGYAIQWQNLFDAPYARTVLPTYPFEKSRYWVTKNAESQWQFTRKALTQASHFNAANFTCLPDGVIAYQIALDTNADYYWKEHRIAGKWCLPGVMNIQAMLAFKENYFPQDALEIQQLTFLRMAFLPHLTGAVFHAEFKPEGTDRWFYKSFIYSENKWQTLATAIVICCKEVPAYPVPVVFSAIEKVWKPTVSAQALYEGHERLGYHLGKPFQWLSDGYYSDGETVRAISHPEGILSDESLYGLYPGLIDACMQCYDSNGHESAMHVEADKTYVPFHIKKIIFQADLQSSQKAWAYALMRNTKEDYKDSSTGDIALFHEDRVVFYMEGIEYRKSTTQTPSLEQSLYHVEWQKTNLNKTDKGNNSALIIQLGGDEAVVEHYYSTAICESDIQLKEKLSQDLASAIQENQQFIIYCPTRKVINGPSQALRVFIQWLLSMGTAYQCSIIVVTVRGQKILADEIVDPVQSQLWGLVRVLRHEHTELNLSLVDIAAINLLSGLLLDLKNEFEWQLAYRDNHFYMPRLKELPIQNYSNLICQPEKVYVIFGGTGGLGLLMTQLLVERGARQFALISRSGKPGSPQLLEPLNIQGIAITLHAVDVLDKKAIENVMMEITQHAAVAGVIFAVGWLEDGIIEQQTREKFDNVMLSKMLGLKQVWDCVSHYNLEFFAAFSSISAVVGTPGQAHYAAANAYLDAFFSSVKKNFPCVSIGWGPWDEVGMAARKKPQLSPIFEQTGVGWISSSQALNFFIAAISAQANHCIAALFDWRRLVTAAAAQDRETWLADILPAEKAGIEKLPVKSASILNRCLEIISQILNIPIEQMDSEQLLNVMGLDSVMALEISGHIQKEFGLEIPLVSLLENASVKWIEEQIMQSTSSQQEIQLKQNMQHCAEIISKTTELPVEQIDIEQKLNVMGLDSVMALEISSAIQQQFGIEIPLVMLLENASVRWIAEHINEVNQQKSLIQEAAVEIVL